MDNVTMKLNADDLILSALKEDITSEDVTTNAIMPSITPMISPFTTRIQIV